MPDILEAALGDWVAEAAPEEALPVAEPDLDADPLAEAEELPVALADPLALELDPEEDEDPPSPVSE
jgi:hypothetical protein